MLISIIVSIYNGENTLRKCLDSLVMQPGREYEIILVDDGSLDTSGQICDIYAEKYGFISVIHQQNGGLSSARKAGYHIAKGDYLMFFDCDDYVSSELIEVLKEKINRSYPDLILYDYYLVNENGERVRRKLNVSSELINNYRADVFAINSIASGWNPEKEPYLTGFVWTRCIKRKILSDKMFISERECYTEDVLFNIELSCNISSIVYIEQPLYYYCVTDNSLTNRYRNNMWDMLLFRQKWITDYCEKHHLTSRATSRLERSWWSAIMMGFDNACNSVSVQSSVEEMRRIRQNQSTISCIESVKKQCSILPRNEKIKLILVAFKLYYIYYLFKHFWNNSV